MNLSPDHTLRFARMWLRNQLSDGVKCPCCGQFAKLYRRPIHFKMAYGLIRAYRECGTEWFNLPELLQRTGSDEAKLRYWGLLEMDPAHVGWYRVTDLGVKFVRGEITVKRWAHVFDGVCVALSGPQRSINDCLGTQFDYAALMRNDA